MSPIGPGIGNQPGLCRVVRLLAAMVTAVTAGTFKTSNSSENFAACSPRLRGLELETFSLIPICTVVTVTDGDGGPAAVQFKYHSS